MKQTNTNTLNTLLANTGKFVTVDVFNTRINRRINGRVVRSTKNYVTIQPSNAKQTPVKINRRSIVEAVGQGMVYSRV